MIRLSRPVLLELGGAFLIANTPISMYESLLRTTAVAKMRDHAEPTDLMLYYDFLTARSKRSAIVIALAYAVLIALLAKSTSQDAQIDSSRLTWGSVVAQTARLKNPPTHSITIDMSVKPTVASTTVGNSSVLILP